MPQIRQTKYLLAILAFIVATVALFTARADFSAWSSFMLILFGLYGASDITNTHLQQKKQIAPSDQTA